MAFYGIYGKNEVMVDLDIHKASIMDIPLIEEWIKFDSWCKPKIRFPSERCNFLPWNYMLGSLRNFEGDFFKVVSNIREVERIEGIIHISLSDGETIIEGLEIAPWNRELYLGEEREFRQLGLILIGYSILYGKTAGSCDRIRLESLETREPYYRDGLGMHEIKLGEFIYTAAECDEFIGILIEKGILR